MTSTTSAQLTIATRPVFAIANLWHASREAKDIPRKKHSRLGYMSYRRCLLCEKVTLDGAPTLSHAQMHIRRGEIEEVKADGIIWETSYPGESKPAWVDQTVGYRTPGAGGWYLVEILTVESAGHGLPYVRGERPVAESFHPTAKEAGGSFWNNGTRPHELREISTSEPPLLSTLDRPYIRARIEKAARTAFGKKSQYPQHLFFEHGHWWLRVSNNVRGDDVTYDVVDAEGPGTYDGFDFEAVD